MRDSGGGGGGGAESAAEIRTPAFYEQMHKLQNIRTNDNNENEPLFWSKQFKRGEL